jgi:hypothetical protein
MDAVILHGGRRRDSGLEAACSRLGDALEGIGTGVRLLRLEEMNVRPCIGCFGCWLRTPGECLQADDGREVARSVVQADARVFLSPVTFGGYSGLLKTALERVVPSISPLFTTIRGEMHHRRRYPYRPIVVGVGWQEAPGREAAETFARLVERNAIDMHARSSESVVVTAAQAPQEQRALFAGLAARIVGATA